MSKSDRCKKEFTSCSPLLEHVLCCLDLLRCSGDGDDAVCRARECFVDLNECIRFRANSTDAAASFSDDSASQLFWREFRINWCFYCFETWTTYIFWYCDLSWCLVNIHVVSKVAAIVLPVWAGICQAGNVHVIVSEACQRTTTAAAATAHHWTVSVVSVMCPRIDVIAHSSVSCSTATTTIHVTISAASTIIETTSVPSTVTESSTTCCCC